MGFEEAYTDWQEGRLTQAEAARLLGVCERTLRRQIDRFEADGMDGLIDRRLTQLSHKRATVDEVMKLVDLYRSGYPNWNTQHFHTWYVTARARATSHM
jgi:DNA-binding Lrp family transcriptional regulator